MWCGPFLGLLLGLFLGLLLGLFLLAHDTTTLEAS